MVNVDGYYQRYVGEELVETRGEDYQALTIPEINAESINSILNEGRYCSDRHHWSTKQGVHVKKLGWEELRHFPPVRFVNSVRMHMRKTYIGKIPKPLGIIYSGGLKDIATQKSKGYFLSESISGDSFIISFKDKDWERKKEDIRMIRLALNEFRENGIYLLDFAPRDIIIQKEFRRLIFADTEDVKFRGDEIHSPSGLNNVIREQIKQFNEDYEVFLTSEELVEARKIVFSSLESTIKI